MPLPLPRDPEFRREVISSWIEDVEDRLEVGRPDDAEESWKIAHSLLLSLPPGEGGFLLEEKLLEARVKISRYHQHL